MWRLEIIFQVMAHYPFNTFELKEVQDEI